MYILETSNRLGFDIEKYNKELGVVSSGSLHDFEDFMDGEKFINKDKIIEYGSSLLNMFISNLFIAHRFTIQASELIIALATTV